MKDLKCNLVSSAQPSGQYQPTNLDSSKVTVDFLLESVGYKLNDIRWKDGNLQRVTDMQLEKLQGQHVWATNF